jgi:hypothetical protein
MDAGGQLQAHSALLLGISECQTCDLKSEQKWRQKEKSCHFRVSNSGHPVRFVALLNNYAVYIQNMGNYNKET